MSALETLLAKLLHYGTWLASLAIAAGIAIGFTGSRAIAQNLATAGIGLLILLPILRVSVMFVFLLRDRDYRLAVAAVLVLAIILIGAVVGYESSFYRA